MMGKGEWLKKILRIVVGNDKIIWILFYDCGLLFL